MKICAVSDLHGHLPVVPPCDLLLVGGDICPLDNHDNGFQAEFLDTDFRRWLEGVPARKIVGTAGNHDFVFQQMPELVPGDLPWVYLQDRLHVWEGLKIWGTPWQPWFFDWAFNLYEDQLLAKWAMIPDDADILVLHAPPHTFGDLTRSGERVGSPGLLARIQEVRPKLAIFGHIHEARGVWQLGPTTLANVSVVDSRYQLVNPATEFEW